MKILMIGVAVIVVVGVVSLQYVQGQSAARPTIATEEDFRRAMKDLSNWGRWGADDELVVRQVARSLLYHFVQS